MAGFVKLLTVLWCLGVLFFGCNLNGSGSVEQDDDRDHTLGVQGDILGRGYDVTGFFADSTTIKNAPVLDYGALQAAGRIKRNHLLNESTIITTAGSSVAEYQRNIGVKASISNSAGVKGIGSFRTQISSSFSEERLSTVNHAFATSSSVHSKEAYYIDGFQDPLSLRPYLTPEFASDLDTMEFAAFVQKYGTHLMLGSIMGARVDYHLSVEMRSSEASRLISAYVKASGEATIKGISFGAERELETSTEFREAFRSESRNTLVVVKGGNPVYGQNISDEQNYSLWHESIVPADYTWIDYYPESLFPLYLFIEDQARRELFEQEYDRYLMYNTLTEAGIVDIIVLRGTTATVNVPEDYILVNQDLNQGAGGRFIYLAYKQGFGEGRHGFPITGLTLVRSSRSLGIGDAPMNFFLLPQDLNEGAGGRYVYLCIRRDATDRPIRTLSAISGRNVQAPAGHQIVTWHDEPGTVADTNYRAGGSFVYITYSK